MGFTGEVDEPKVKGKTFEQWLVGSPDRPEGFGVWKYTKELWLLGNPLEDVLATYKASKAYHNLQEGNTKAAQHFARQVAKGRFLARR